MTTTQEVGSRLEARITAFENRLDAAQAQINRRLDKLFYTMVGIYGTLLVGMAIILIRDFF